MNRMQKPMRTLVCLSIMALMDGPLYAGGFSLYTESSAAAIGNYAAGIAAEGYDASIGWYNPAGLVLIKEQQVLLGGVGVFPSAKLTGTSAYSTIIPGGGGQISTYSESFNSLQAAKNALVPSFHYAQPLGERAVFGLSIVSPFGLSTEYDLSSPVRYAATWSQLQTINLSPELGGRLTDHLSIGGGIDFQYANVKFNRMLGAPASMQAVGEPPAILDSESYNTGDSFAVGFHAGLLLMFNEEHTRVGLNYQSHMNHQFMGHSILTGILADPTFSIYFPSEQNNPKSTFTSDNLTSNYISLPNIVTLSAYQDITERWALLGSLVYSGWSSFQSIQLYNVAAYSIPDLDTGLVVPATVNATTPEDYRDTWRFALGANYRVNEQWLIRMGGGYDQTPTVYSERDVRLPDANRWALSIGAHYQIRYNLGFDAGYSYLFANSTADINNTSKIGAISTYNVNAAAKVNAQLFGLQVVWLIDAEKPKA